MNAERALDSQKRRVSVTAISASHRQYAPRIVAVVDPDYIAAAVQAIARRLDDVQRKQGIGGYVFIDDNLRAYVVTETQPIAATWVRERIKWLVGFYSRVKVEGVPLSVPTPEGLAEDIGEHLQQLGAAA